MLKGQRYYRLHKNKKMLPVKDIVQKCQSKENLLKNGADICLY